MDDPLAADPGGRADADDDDNPFAPLQFKVRDSALIASASHPSLPFAARDWTRP